MNRIVKSAKGAISIFVALMMAGILSLGTFVIEEARFQAAKTQLGEATASAATSMLSSYNTDLNERYKILAIDTTRSNPTTCKGYLEFNSDLATGYFGNTVTRLYGVEDVQMTGVYNLTYPHILKRQILTIAKYNLVPEHTQFNMYNASYVLDELQEKCDFVSSKMTEIQDASKSGSIDALNPQLKSALFALDKAYMNLNKSNDKNNITITSGTFAQLPSQTGIVQSEIPADDIADIDAVRNDATKYLGISAAVLSSSPVEFEETNIILDQGPVKTLQSYHSGSWLGSTSQANYVVNNYLGLGADSIIIKYKSLSDDINRAIEILEGDRDGNLLLNSYISQTFSNRNYVADQYIGPGFESSESTKDNMTFSKASCEYVFGGDVSEKVNQQKAYDYIMSYRLIGNLYAVFNESTHLDMTNAYSIAAHLAWAYYETCVDMELLTAYNVAVPLTKDHLILPINNPGVVAGAFASKVTANALHALGYYNPATETFDVAGRDCLNYTDSLSFGLWFVPNSQKLLRTADLMQLEMRYKQQYIDNLPATFLMSEQNTYCRVECNARMNSILPIISIGGADHSLNGLSFSSMKYVGY